MNLMHWPRTRWAALSLAACAALTACGGSGDIANLPTSGNPTPTDPVITNPTTPVALAPLAGGSDYLGTLSVGDTVAVALNTTAKTVTVRFTESRFGLAGSLVSAYTTQADGSLLASQFSVVDGSGVPAKLSSQLSGLTLRFTASGALVSGSFSNLPNALAATGTLLQGQLTASNRGAAKVADIAGTYSFVKQWASYTAAGAVVEAPAVEFGQLKINADGTARACLYQAYSDTCANGVTGQVAAEADQTRFPGALAVTFNGKQIGRAIVASGTGANTLLVDEYEAGTNGSYTTGSWVLQTAAVQAATALDGEWLCSEPETGTTGLPTGRTLRRYVSIAGGVLQTDTVDADIALTANASLVPSSTATVAGVNGLFAGQWSSTKAPARVLMPVGTDTVYVAGNNGATGAARADLSGLCRRLPVQDTVQTYLSAEAGKVSMVSIGDARPTQPAIGYDQVYYKQGRYRHTSTTTGTSTVVSTVWQKAFDDLCEDSGQKEAAVKAKDTTKTDVTLWKLNDRSTFDCTVTEAARTTSGLKTAVVGPKGLLYLTDGHHTFTSLYEAPNNQGTGATAGGTVKMPVVIQSNDKDLSNAAFWRKMRAAKYVWLKDPDGKAITPADLPAQIGLSNGLKEDRYRGLVYYTRDVGYTPPSSAPEYLEFYWGDWLKAAPQSIDLSKYDLTMLGKGDGTDKGYMQAIKDASMLMVNAAPATVIGNDPAYTAQTMGALTGAFGQTVFDELDDEKPVTGKKAGKLAYALEYRKSLTSK